MDFRNVEPVSALANRVSVEDIRILKFRDWRLIAQIGCLASDEHHSSTAETNERVTKWPKRRPHLQNTEIAHRGRTGWLGREDSNLRMAESKSAALPLGYAPMRRRIAAGRPRAVGQRNIAARPPSINVGRERSPEASQQHLSATFRIKGRQRHLQPLGEQDMQFDLPHAGAAERQRRQLFDGLEIWP